MTEEFQRKREDGMRCSGEAMVRNLLREVGSHRGRPADLADLLSMEDGCARNTACPGPALMSLSQRCQHMLELQLEPLLVNLCRWTDGADAYPSEQLNGLWAAFLECHSDNLDRDDVKRMREVLETAETMRVQALSALVKRIDRVARDTANSFLTVVNTLPYERAEMVEAAIDPLEKNGFDAFGLLDERGNPVEFDLLQVDSAGSQQRHIRFRAAVPAGGYRTYTLYSPAAGGDLNTLMRPAPQGWVMQNECMRVAVGTDGQVDLLDSETGIESPNIFGFEGAEALDVSDQPVVSIIENKGVRLDYRFGVTINLSLDAGSRHLSVLLKVDASVGGHGLRLLVHTDVHSDECISSQPFRCVSRSNASQDGSAVNNGLVSVKDWNKQMTIFNTGLYDFTHHRDDRGTIGFTLVSESEPNQTAGASYRLAIRPGQAGKATLLQEMQCFHVPLLAIFDAVDSTKFSGGRPDVGDAELQEYRHRHSILSERRLPMKHEGLKMDANVVFSALKQSMDRESWILRFFNPSENEVCLEHPRMEAKVSSLDEVHSDIPWSRGSIVKAKKIVTLRF